jgi:hypothetical protein
MRGFMYQNALCRLRPLKREVLIDRMRLIAPSRYWGQVGRMYSCAAHQTECPHTAYVVNSCML